MSSKFAIFCLIPKLVFKNREQKSFISDGIEKGQDEYFLSTSVATFVRVSAAGIEPATHGLKGRCSTY